MKILAKFKILECQNPEFKIFGDFKIFQSQNPEFKISAIFKIFQSQNGNFKILGDLNIPGYLKTGVLKLVSLAH